MLLHYLTDLLLDFNFLVYLANLAKQGEKTLWKHPDFSTQSEAIRMFGLFYEKTALKLFSPL